MNLSNLTIQQEFKNFRKLCEYIEIPYKPSDSRWKARTLSDLERYFVYETRGQKIIITNIYNSPLPEGFKENAHNIKMFTSAVITNLYTSNFDTNTLYIRSATQILKEIGLLNDEFLLINRITNPLFQKEFELFITKSKFDPLAVIHWQEAISKVTFETIQLSKYLTTLSNKGYCTFHKQLYTGDKPLTIPQMEEWEITKRNTLKKYPTIQHEFILFHLSNIEWMRTNFSPVVDKYIIHWNSNIYIYAEEDGYTSMEKLIKIRNDKAVNIIKEKLNLLNDTQKIPLYSSVGKWLSIIKEGESIG